MKILHKLPQTPEDINGWPWKEEVHFETYLSEGYWPKISIVVPSYNQGKYIEETIRSILLQNYPNLELIVVDGGSTDETIEVIKKYDQWIDYWVSEKDNGQSHAINKGLDKVTGEIFNWLNSDDLLEKGALLKIGQTFTKYKNIEVLRGRVLFFGNNQTYVKSVKDSEVLEKCIAYLPYYIIQPSTFIKTELFHKEHIGKVNESMNYVFDLEWMLKYYLMKGKSKIMELEDILARFRLHDSSKTVSQMDSFFKETINMYGHLFKIKEINSAFINFNLSNYAGYVEFDQSRIIEHLDFKRVHSYYLLSQLEEAYYPVVKKALINSIRKEIKLSKLNLKDKFKAIKIYIIATVLPEKISTKIRKIVTA